MRIKDDRIGYGRFRLTRSIPMKTVQRIEVSERSIEAVEPQVVIARGLPASGGKFAKGARKVFTDISVYTTDGQTALWVVEQRGAEWVQRKLAPILERSRIPLD